MGASLIHHALSEPLRLRIPHALAIQPLCVCVIKDIVGIADSKLSYHLNQSKKAGLIEGDQQGSWIIYHLTPLGERCMAAGLSPLRRVKRGCRGRAPTPIRRKTDHFTWPGGSHPSRNRNDETLRPETGTALG